MKTPTKLNVLLAVTDQLRSSYKHMIAEYNKYFLKNQGSFKGEKRTYIPREGTIDDPTKKGIQLVVTTVDEKLQYFIESNEKFIDALFAQEATNATGNAKAELVVEGESWGEFTSLELLRLRSLIEGGELGDLATMIQNIPVRSDSEVWIKSENEEYVGREIYETEMFKGVAKTTIKKPIVLVDPNLVGRELPANYQPAKAQLDEILELGDYTKQNFSGEWNHSKRANALRRRNILSVSITEALKQANQCVCVESDLKAKKIFDYIFYNKK